MQEPGALPGSLRFRPSEHRDVLQQRNHAEHDDDDAHDLFGTAVERQQVDQIENEDDDEEGDESADKHANSPIVEGHAVKFSLTHATLAGSLTGTFWVGKTRTFSTIPVVLRRSKL